MESMDSIILDTVNSKYDTLAETKDDILDWSWDNITRKDS
jgi:hypothetical protein